MKDSLLYKLIRTSILLLSLLTILPLGTVTNAQTPNSTPYQYARTENVDRDRGGDNWGWLGLLGLAGLLGLMRRRETTYGGREHARTPDTAGRPSY
ncbi:MAG: WGxxGxxG-CTERM domain-containing protein [Blastocatellia bacterium]|nr:WGxxGxxG-CTERM domain-containing protein [Blastocatellia bacterium]